MADNKQPAVAASSGSSTIDMVARTNVAVAHPQYLEAKKQSGFRDAEYMGPRQFHYRPAQSISFPNTEEGRAEVRRLRKLNSIETPEDNKPQSIEF